MHEFLEKVWTCIREMSHAYSNIVEAAGIQCQLKKCTAALVGLTIKNLHRLLNDGIGDVAAKSIGAEDKSVVRLSGK